MMLVSLMGKWDKTFPSNDNKTPVSTTTAINRYDDTPVSSPVSAQNKEDEQATLTTNTVFAKYDNSPSVNINTGVFKNLKVSLYDGAIISTSL